MMIINTDPLKDILDNNRNPASEAELLPPLDMPEPEPETLPETEKPPLPPLAAGKEIALLYGEVITGGCNMLAGENDYFEFPKENLERMAVCIDRMGVTINSPVLGLMLAVIGPTVMMGCSAFSMYKKKKKAKKAAAQRPLKPKHEPEPDDNSEEYAAE